LAALHYNENSNRCHAITADGDKRYKVVYPKFKQGGYSVRPIQVDPTFRYVNTLLELIWSIYTGEADVLAVNPFDNPPPLCSSFQHPVKTEAVQKHRSRFNLTI
jgi:hypothetical protein